MTQRIVPVFVLLMAITTKSHEGQPPAVGYYNPDWSPDGSRVVFESTRDGKSAIYTIRVNGSDLEKLTDGTANDAQPRWFADGKRIVFISDRDGPSHIYIMDSDGRNQRRVTDSSGVDFRPDVSPRGDRIAFMSRPAANGAEYDIHVVGTDGSGRRRLTTAGADDTAPVWSPDGRRLAFLRGAIINYRGPAEEVRRARATTDIVVMAADGSNPMKLTHDDVRDCCVSWSTDGSVMYFVSDRDGAPGVYVMHADGTNVQRVADGALVTDPNVSPDGRYFVYARVSSGTSGIYVYDRTIGAERPLIESGRAGQLAAPLDLSISDVEKALALARASRLLLSRPLRSEP